MDWYVLEYNVRLGDPEAQALLAHIKTDFLEVLVAALNQNLDKIKLEYNEDISACLTLLVKGIRNLQKMVKKLLYLKSLQKIRDIKIFYAGVEEKDGELYSKAGASFLYAQHHRTLSGS